MSPLTNTPRRACEQCKRSMEPRKSESKHGYQHRRFCGDRCADTWTRNNRIGAVSTLGRFVWEGISR